MRENDGKHIVKIIGRQVCKKHKADIGEPCYSIPSGTSDVVHVGVCNKRAILFGANGKISDASLRKTRSQIKTTKAKGRSLENYNKQSAS